MKEKFVCTFLLLLTLASCDRPDPSGVSRPASLPSATAPTAPPPTFTKTVTSTLTATATPEPTTTSTATPTPAPTATITASPRVEAIRKLVGDQPEDWFRWNEDIQGWEIWLIYPGEQSISQEPYEFSGADGKVIGKAWSWFTAEYLIGNQIRQ